MKNHETRLLEHLNLISKNLSSFTYSQLKEVVYRLLPNFPISVSNKPKYHSLIKTDLNNFDGKLLFHARPSELDNYGRYSKKPFFSLSEIDIAPDCIKEKFKFGRCNIAHDIKFYCSYSPITACLESATKGFIEPIGSKFVTVGCWEVIEPLNLAGVYYSKRQIESVKYINPELYSKIASIAEKWHNHLDDILEPYNGYSQSFSKELLLFFADQFGKTEIRTEKDYFLSALYCDSVFNRATFDDNSNFDGIAYPSVRNAFQEYNIVLHRRAMEKLAFRYAMFYVLNKNGMSLMPLKVDESMVDSQGKLIWEIHGRK